MVVGPNGFPVSKGTVIATIPEVKPPMHYHSLIAEAGPSCRVKRHREFIQFQEKRVYPAYVLAYHRNLNGHRV